MWSSPAALALWNGAQAAGEAWGSSKRVPAGTESGRGLPQSKTLLQPPDDPGLVQIIGGHLHLHPVAHGEADPAFAHLAAYGGEDDVLVGQLDAKHRAREHGVDAAFDFNGLFLHSDGGHHGSWTGVTSC